MSNCEDAVHDGDPAKTEHDQPSMLYRDLSLLLVPILTPLALPVIVLLSLLLFLWFVVLPIAATGYLLHWLIRVLE